jgi:hypothetical protein
MNEKEKAKRNDTRYLVEFPQEKCVTKFDRHSLLVAADNGKGLGLLNSNTFVVNRQFIPSGLNLRWIFL